jgi:hypothetical protein
VKYTCLIIAMLVACERDTSKWGAPTTGSSTGSAAVSAQKPLEVAPDEPAPVEEANTLRIGDRVSAEWPRNKLWYPGRITAVYSDGTADIKWDDDGSRTKGLTFDKIKLVKRPLWEAEVSTAPAKKKKQGLVEGAWCAGPGWQYVCGGRCTDTKTDSANCGKCGNRCDSGYSCDGSGTCRDANGSL